MDESGEIEAGRPFETASSEFAVPVPWYFNVIDSWGRLHLYVATGFAASSLLVLGFLLVRALVAGYIVSSSVIALHHRLRGNDRLPADFAVGDRTDGAPL